MDGEPAEHRSVERPGEGVSGGVFCDKPGSSSCADGFVAIGALGGFRISGWRCDVLASISKMAILIVWRLCYADTMETTQNRRQLFQHLSEIRRMENMQFHFERLSPCCAALLLVERSARTYTQIPRWRLITHQIAHLACVNAPAPRGDEAQAADPEHRHHHCNKKNNAAIMLLLTAPSTSPSIHPVVQQSPSSARR